MDSGIWKAFEPVLGKSAQLPKSGTMRGIWILVLLDGPSGVLGKGGNSEIRNLSGSLGKTGAETRKLGICVLLECRTYFMQRAPRSTHCAMSPTRRISWKLPPVCPSRPRVAVVASSTTFSTRPGPSATWASLHSKSIWFLRSFLRGRARPNVLKLWRRAFRQATGRLSSQIVRRASSAPRACSSCLKRTTARSTGHLHNSFRRMA